MHPAVYIDDRQKWHDDYWHMTFTNPFDCWDRLDSEYDQDSPPIELLEVNYYNIYNFSLDVKAIEGRTLKDRLLFKMGGTMQAHVTCHRSIISAFSSDENGIDISPIHRT